MHRRTLPHWYVPGAAHFVTYRIAGTLPVHALEELKSRKAQLEKQVLDRSQTLSRRDLHKLLYVAYENFLDRVSEIDWLRDARLAAMIRQNLYHHDGSKYHLHSYCIMPNHVHILFTPSPTEMKFESEDDDFELGECTDVRSPLSRIMHSLKSYTANEANRLLNRQGTFWQAESYDHWVRDENEFERILHYIRANPVSAGLVAKHEDWYWSSCHDRFLHDGDKSGWLVARAIGG